MISHRLLTVLLFAATLSVIVAACSAARQTSAPLVTDLAIVLCLTQIGLLSIWLALGRAGWWFRFAAWSAGLIAVGCLSPSTGDAVMHFVRAAIYACSVWLLITSAQVLELIGPAKSKRHSVERRWPQYSILHLLVWTTVAAVLATLIRIRNAPIDHWLLVFTCLSANPVIAVVALKGQRRSWTRLAGVLLFVALVGMVAWLCFQQLQPQRDFAKFHGRCLEYVALCLIQAAITSVWIMVVDYETTSLASVRCR